MKISELLEMRDRRDAYQRDYDSSVSGMDRGNNHRDDERHDLDPSDWYIVKDGKMYKTSVYPRDEQEATRRGYSRTREEANAKAKSTDEAMGADMGKITKVDPTTKKATLTKPDGTSMEVDSTALKPTPDFPIRLSIIFSRPENAPPTMNKTFVVSI